MSIRCISFSLLVMVAGSLLCCDVKRSFSIPELEDYVNDVENGLHKTKSVESYEFGVYYRPKDLVVAQHLQDSFDDSEVDKIKHRLDSLDYFILHLSNNGHEIENSYASVPGQLSEIVNYLSFDIQNDIFLINQGDTLKPLDIVYTRTYGASKSTSVMIIFKSCAEKRTGELNFVFHDTRLGTGISQFNFKAEDIRKIPTLNLN